MTSLNDGYEAKLRGLYLEAMRQGREFEGQAEQWRLEAEKAYGEVGDMKAEGRRRSLIENTRMLPSHERAIDVRTNTYKVMQDAKGDYALYMATMANTYGTLATMKYAKASALMAEIQSLT